MRLILTDTLNTNLKKDEIIEVSVEKMTFGGDALSHYNGFVIFIKGGCPDDLLRVKIVKLNKHYAKAEITEIIKPSPHRIKPFCPLFNACGACQWQYIDYDFLLTQKKNILSEALNSDFYIEDMAGSPKLRGYRCKTQYPVSETKNSKRILAGYYRENSHDITNIKFCPAQDKTVDEIVEYIRENWDLGAFVEKTKKGLLRHIVIKKSSTTEDILLILVLNSDKKKDINSFASSLKKKFSNIRGILVNYNPHNSNKIMSDKTELVLGNDFYTEKFGDKKFKIGAESFFQVNPFCANEIFSEIKKFIKPNSTLLDCYGGVGIIGSYLADLTKSTTLIEINSEACRLAEENYKSNGVKDFEIIEGDVKDVLKSDKTFDYSVIDPPRKGCEKDVLNILSKISKNIIYVSCNPQTLSRDIKILQEFGFKLKYVKPFDMFPYTYHMETLCFLEQ